jgi:hypothetical protein
MVMKFKVRRITTYGEAKCLQNSLTLIDQALDKERAVEAGASGNLRTQRRESTDCLH